MTWDQLRLFEVPEAPPAAQAMHVRVEVDLPGPGYDHLAVEVLNDTLSRLCHDQGLFPSRVAVDVELDYIDDGWFGDDMKISDDSMTTDPVSAPIRRPQLE